MIVDNGGDGAAVTDGLCTLMNCSKKKVRRTPAQLLLLLRYSSSSSSSQSHQLVVRLNFSQTFV
jgi:hypothetical protein